MSMLRLRTRVVAVLVCAAGFLGLTSRQAAAGHVRRAAPDGGWLLLEGGGKLAGTDIAKRFVALAGGPGRNYVVISTAISDSQFTAARLARCAERSAQILGVAHVTCLDARDRGEANSAGFNEVVRTANGVWIYGGDEERLVDRYVGTAVVPSLRAVLDRGGVLGGTSAGAMILASYVPIRGTLPVSAFGFLANTTIAPHYTQRHYEGELRGVLTAHPRLRGIGIDESTAIVVHGDDFDVIGDGTVTVMGRRTTVLHPGQRFDYASESVVSGARSPGAHDGGYRRSA